MTDSLMQPQCLQLLFPAASWLQLGLHGVSPQMPASTILNSVTTRDGRDGSTCDSHGPPQRTTAWSEALSRLCALLKDSLLVTIGCTSE